MNCRWRTICWQTVDTQDRTQLTLNLWLMLLIYLRRMLRTTNLKKLVMYRKFRCIRPLGKLTISIEKCMIKIPRKSSIQRNIENITSVVLLNLVFSASFTSKSTKFSSGNLPRANKKHIISVNPLFLDKQTQQRWGPTCFDIIWPSTRNDELILESGAKGADKWQAQT